MNNKNVSEYYTKGDDEEENDSWILKEAAIWAANSEMEFKKDSPFLDEPVETSCSASTNVISKRATIDLMTKSCKNKTIKRQHHLLSAQPAELQSSSSSPKNVYSLHVTQISYHATEDDIRQHFVQAGCIGIQSIRLVYDFSRNDSKTKAISSKRFRGVAFIDLSDLQSYQYALQKLHGSLLLSRKINVRPVKSKMELANIVKQTQTIVSEKIRIEKEKKLQINGTNNTLDTAKNNTLHKRKKDQPPSESNLIEMQSPSLKRKRDSTSPASSKHFHIQSSTNAKKITKQQRNRRAAILLAKHKS